MAQANLSWKGGLTVMFLALILCLRAFSIADSPDVKKTESKDEPDVKSAINPATPEPGKTTVGHDIKLFGEEVASRIDRIVQRKAFDLWGDPWTLQGIPLIFPSPDDGFHVGMRVALQNIRRQDPHKAEVVTQILASDRGRYKHSFKVDLPHAFGGLYRFTGRCAYDRDIHARYFGIGNDTTVDRRLYEQDSVLYRSVQAVPSIYLQMLQRFGDHFLAGPIVGFKWVRVTAPAGSLLERDNPLGIAGGNSNFAGIAFVWNNIDFEPYPSEGVWHELYLAWYNRWLGSNYSFLRTTYTYRKYYPIYGKLIFAHRTLVESLAGNVPYFEMSVVGGSDSTIAFGGDRFFRGYESNRFMDKVRLVLGFELRWDPIEFEFTGQHITMGFVPFFDFGRVWPAMLPLRLGHWHASAGYGTRIIWNSRFIIRGDFAVNAERTSFFLELGNSF